MTYEPVGELPTLDEVRAWVQVPATVVTDDQLGYVVGAELWDQLALCAVPLDYPDTYPDNLRQALLRRVGRALAAKGLPLGVIAEEFGTARLPRWDAEVERLEMPDRLQVVG